MKLFYTNATAKEEIGNLETRIQSLESDGQAAASEISRLQGELATANENLTTVTAERDQARADLATANATIAERDATIAAHPTEEQITARIEAGALAKFQSLGGKEPVSGSEEEDESDPKTRTMKNWSKKF